MNFLRVDVHVVFYVYSTLCCVSTVVKVSLFRLWHLRWTVASLLCCVWL